ncbi:hypothetical protein [Mycoplasma sp. ATU-Cv-508]|uniref:hypothetical protein n=1 Tax=Mycoplasma sp. ATU-Cv-508 TaxID=2048001 RepID=UPI001374F428
MSIKIDFLVPESTISGQLLTTILAVSILGLFAAVATVITLVIRHRRRRLG